MYYVYILTNWKNNVVYTGVTNDLKRRIYEHKKKVLPGFTNDYNVNKLVYFESYNNIDEAIIREKQIKGWRREKKNLLVEKQNPGWVDLTKGW